MEGHLALSAIAKGGGVFDIHGALNEEHQVKGHTESAVVFPEVILVDSPTERVELCHLLNSFSRIVYFLLDSQINGASAAISGFEFRLTLFES